MSIEFTINGIPFVVDPRRLPADIALNSYIREHAGLSGTKFMCLEGGCGVCICVVEGKHPVSGEKRSWAVNSCLTLLNTCDGLDITTIEGIGNNLDGYHPIQSRLAQFNGSQCGYCSPGMVMNMYALLKSKGGKVTMNEVENSFGGNICRCTGYRPIMDAMKSFTLDGKERENIQDIEDLSLKCPKTGQKCSGICERAAVTYPSGERWYWPKTLKELLGIVGSFGAEKYMLVAGNTAHGVYRRSEDIKDFVDVTKIPDLHFSSIVGENLTLGGNLSLNDTMEVFRKAAGTPGFEYCQELWNHFDLIANVPVRNVGTLAGNLMIKHDHPEFPSDVFLTFEALAATIIIESGSGTRTIDLGEFLKTDMRGRIILGINLKSYSKDKFIFRSFKVMPRAQNAHAYVNSAFLLELDRTNGTVASAKICFGGINPNFIHATEIEKLLVGKSLFSNDVFKQIFDRLASEINPDLVLPDTSAEYRNILACGLFYKFLLSIVPGDKIRSSLKSGGDLLKRPLSSGQQKFETTSKTFPVTEPVQKLEAVVQCAGEAKYMNDLPSQPNQVWCAFVNATKVGAWIVAIDTSAAFKIPGVIAFYSAQDIPGKNSFVSTDFFAIESDEEIFCEQRVKYYNQPLGIIVAESGAAANLAASKVSVIYSDGSPKVFATMKDVLEAKQFDRIRDVVISSIKELKPASVPAISASGSLDLGQQYHFTMEPHSTVVIPTEGRLEVHSSTQWMDLTQCAIAKCLGMSMNDVRLIVRRLGGGFGCKISRGNQVACAAAIAAIKLNRPVRFVQTIESMMATGGKRWACYNEYKFHTTSSGKILALQNTFYQDAGLAVNENAIEELLLPSLKSCYDLAGKFKIDGKICFTDTPSHTWCRGPGSLEGIAMIEAIMEHIAFEARLDPVAVRLENIAADHKIRPIVGGFLKATEYEKRKKEIERFNETNRWRKKGLGFSFMQFDVLPFGPYPATVAIYHTDGTVIVTHGGIEMGQGINTKAAQVAAYTLGIPLNMVRIEASDTLNGANAFVTGASVGSESVCFAVRKACDTLMNRLRPVKESMRDWTWRALVEEAQNKGINLIACEHLAAGDIEPYLIYGMALTEVEIDILTGNNLIRRVDILEETGKSLNPSVDIGQIEGAFVMGLGYFLTEELIYDRKIGKLMTNRTWNYKPPGCKDIPIDFRIELLQKGPNPAGFMRSKTTGEPAICLSVSSVFAVQQALQSARNDAGLPRKWIGLGAPTTPEHIVLNSGSNVSQFRL